MPTRRPVTADGRGYAPVQYPRLTPVVRAIVAGVVVTTVLQVVAEDTGHQSPLLQALALYPSLVAHGQVWRLLTYVFAPYSLGELGSLVFALLTIWLSGSPLETAMGSRRFALFAAALAVIPASAATLIDAFNPAFYTTPSGGPSHLGVAFLMAWVAWFPDGRVYLLPPQIAGRYAPIVATRTLGIWIAISTVVYALASSQLRSAALPIASVATGWLLASNWWRVDRWLDRREAEKKRKMQATKPAATHRLRVIRGGLDDDAPKDKSLLN
jgi:membrane associated rhomboid family serine protease